MKFYAVLFGTFLILNLTGCTSAQDMKDEANAEYTQEKTQTLKEYKECVNKSGGVAEKMAQCEALLKAVGAMEGSTVTSAPAPAATPAAVESTQPVGAQPVEATETTEDSK